jgi:hypothetical protein
MKTGKVTRKTEEHLTVLAIRKWFVESRLKAKPISQEDAEILEELKEKEKVKAANIYFNN